jgi:hypothetical protein
MRFGRPASCDDGLGRCADLPQTGSTVLPMPVSHAPDLLMSVGLRGTPHSRPWRTLHRRAALREQTGSAESLPQPLDAGRRVLLVGGGVEHASDALKC